METKLLESDQKKDGLLYMRLANDILHYVQEKQIKTGERIPSERSLAELFHTSRTSVREAVRILENKNILEIQIGNGMYLKSDFQNKSYSIELWKIDYMELLDIKTTLEFHIIEELCFSSTPADIMSAEEALKVLEIAYENGYYDQSADNLFHKRIRICTDNQTLIQLLDNLISKLDEYAEPISEMRSIWYQTVPYHRDLLEAIRRHDVVGAHNAFYKIYELDKIALKNK